MAFSIPRMELALFNVPRPTCFVYPYWVMSEINFSEILVFVIDPKVK